MIQMYTHSVPLFTLHLLVKVPGPESDVKQKSQGRKQNPENPSPRDPTLGPNFLSHS